MKEKREVEKTKKKNNNLLLGENHQDSGCYMGSFKVVPILMLTEYWTGKRAVIG